MTDKRWGLATQTWRRLSQVFFLFALNPFVWRLWPGMGPPAVAGVCVPALNCWSCPAAALSCPIGAVGQFLARGVVPVLAVGTMVLAGALLGRVFCGWICPFGFLQDLMHKIPSGWKARPPHALRHLKYVLLVGSVVLIPLFFGVAPGLDRPSGWFFCSLCPAGTLEASIPINLQLVAQGDQTFAAMVGGFAGSVKFWILVAFLVSFVYYHRPFCKIACPIGAFLGLFNKVSLFRYGRKRSHCSSCRACRDVCPDIPDVDISADPPDCIRCYLCSPSPCMEDWDLRLRLETCKACGICYRLCPTGALEEGPDGKPRVRDPGACIGCGMCVRRCPEMAVRLLRRGEARDEAQAAAPQAPGEGGAR